MTDPEVHMSVSTWRRPEPEVGLRLSRRSGPTGEVVVLAGVLDAAGAPALRSCLLDVAESADVEVDISGLTFIDSTGIGVLVAAIHRARDHSRRLRVSGARPSIQAVFELTGVDRLLAKAAAPPPPGGAGAGWG